ncbi:hypothetical protein CEXT_733761 [Caerostris extrusa]|uniref:Uncharacterized protein n=1 Tax=Caerostris extrusa TaxID=172846 RepID=A0AAV4SNP1_CAEEX|nr:hypothetical protein CEXT_733761 [Caerostris extrusa]
MQTQETKEKRVGWKSIYQTGDALNMPLFHARGFSNAPGICPGTSRGTSALSGEICEQTFKEYALDLLKDPCKSSPHNIQCHYALPLFFHLCFCGAVTILLFHLFYDRCKSCGSRKCRKKGKRERMRITFVSFKRAGRVTLPQGGRNIQNPSSKPLPSKFLPRKQVSERRFYTSRPVDTQIKCSQLVSQENIGKIKITLFVLKKINNISKNRTNSARLDILPANRQPNLYEDIF